MNASLTSRLDALAGSKVPGLQYVVVDAGGTRFEYAGGWADLRERQPMTLATTMMAYSMTKTWTAIAVLQLVESGKLSLESALDDVLPGTPYRGHGITVRQLLSHTAGLPNPIPLRWAHLIEDDARFDERAALDRVLAAHPRLVSAPGQKFAYTNLGYWLLGRVIEQVQELPYSRHVRERLLAPLGLGAEELGFQRLTRAAQAGGYLARYSAMNLLKGLVTDSRMWGGYEGRWLRIRDHYPDGAAFGGMIGTAHAFARLLQDQLQPTSVLLGADMKRMLETRERTAAGEAIGMTLGWHVRAAADGDYLFKEGGGAGFHAEMRLYPARSLGSVVMANSTTFETRRVLDEWDPVTMGSARG